MDAPTLEAVLALPKVVGVFLLVLALTQYVKKLVPDRLHDKLVPGIAIALGAGILYLQQYFPDNLFFQGAVIGLTATGLYGAAVEKFSTK